MAIIYPSLLAANPLNLEKTIKELDPYCHGYHLDTMDNQFCPNVAFGIDILNAISTITIRPLWVHLMVQKPEDWIEKIQIPGGSLVTIHFESQGQHKKIIKRIREKKWLAGLAIKPKTKVEEIFPIIDELDQILIMSVEPGFAGQPFLEETVSKIDPLVGYRQTKKLKYRIAMDGAINEFNIHQLAHKGVDDFAVGSALFKKQNLIETLKKLEELAQ